MDAKEQLYDMEHQAFLKNWEVVKYVPVPGDGIQAPGFVTVNTGSLTYSIHLLSTSLTHKMADSTAETIAPIARKQKKRLPSVSCASLTNCKFLDTHAVSMVCNSARLISEKETYMVNLGSSWHSAQVWSNM